MRSAAAAAFPLLPVDDSAEAEALGPELVEELVRDIARSLAELPRPKPRLREFAAPSPAAARTAAVEWLRDFATHGPLELESIRTESRADGFVAAVTYRTADGQSEDEAEPAADEEAPAPDTDVDAAPAQPCVSGREAGEAAAQPFAFKPPAVPKLPPVTPLRVARQA